MNDFTHLGIAKAVKQAVEQELPVKLNTMGFLYGNVKPDLSPMLYEIPHYKKNSFDFVKQEIKRLMGLRLESSSICSKQFSESLGILTHYLSDYFCYAHSEPYKGSLFSHYIYEMDLSVYCKRHAKKIRMHNYPGGRSVYTDYQALCNYIEKLHCEYMSKKPSFESDIAYALRACTTLSLSILLTYSRGKMAEAA